MKTKIQASFTKKLTFTFALICMKSFNNLNILMKGSKPNIQNSQELKISNSDLNIIKSLIFISEG